MMQIMDGEGKQEPSLAPMPVLPRLNRLDRLLQLLEEKHGTSGTHLTDSVISKTENEEDGHSKTLSFALEEVRQKGTLMDRLAILENRVLQLSLVMDERNSSRSRSSSSTTAHIVSEISDAQNVAGQEKGETETCLEQQDSLQSQGIKSGARKKIRSRSRKLRGWFRISC